MAKRHKAQNRKFPLPVVAFGAVLVLAAALLYAFGGSPGAGGTPQLAVEPGHIDYGDVKLDTDLTFQIKVTNQGDGVLRFAEQPYIEVVEGC